MHHRSYVAIGDSFTEGLDDFHPDGLPRGWADRVAESLAARYPGFAYANLAVRGKVLDEIVDEQLPVAESLRPDLITFCAGGNDIIGWSCDVDELAARFDAALGRLVATGAEVLILTGFDLRRMHPLIRRLRGRIACYNEDMRASAERHGCRVVDLWAMDALADPRAWGRDRLHLVPHAHERVAWRVLEALGEPAEADWRAPWPEPADVPARLPTWRDRQVEDLRWVRDHVMPFVLRRLRAREYFPGLRPRKVLTGASAPTAPG
ncbi:SGNH/GDSL hydrolase family protein [Pseudonocardia nematodicida]|uniref:SGNH/GDSL hydrolase family protein n=1 Tax=Pseudonocardia nematodicida TaxID=1206997 RepID=A0ABV1KC75_9PSEU